MAYETTPLGLQLPIPGTGQAFETAVYNDNLRKLEAALAAIGKPQFKTNVLYASGSQPSIGAGYAQAVYTTVAGFCIVQYSIFFNGGGSSTGGGNWGLRLPVPLAVGNGGRFVLSGVYERNGTSGASNFSVFATFDAGDTSNAAVIRSDSGTLVGSNIPNLAKNGDRMFVHGVYPVVAATAL